MGTKLIAKPLSLGLFASLALIGCNADDMPADEMANETSMTDGDGDGDGGDGDGDGDGDSDGDGDGDGAPGCSELGCECTGDTCDAGLSCVAGSCQQTVCGDGEVQGDEECEDGNQVDGDGCDNDCTYTKVAQIAAGQHHTCALIDGGRLRCWGRGEFGQLGYPNVDKVGDDEDPAEMGDVPLPSPVLRFSLGAQHTCALLQDGLRCWGLNDRGQLGTGDLDNLGDDESLETLAPLELSPVSDIALGNRFSCARVGNGEVHCWGMNNQGQLGYANTLAPTLEMSLPGGPVTTGGVVSSLSLGWYHSCVTFVLGGVRCWGRNDKGQLGYANTNNVGDNELPNAAGLVDVLPPDVLPNTDVISLALGGNHSCALLSDGQLMCWGDNGSGQLGYGDTENTGDDESPSTRAPVAIDSAKAVVAGANHTCVLRTDGSVMCWGDNTVGQLGYGKPGIGNIGNDETPQAFVDSNGPVDIGGEAKQLAAGGNHTCALLTNGDVVCWGENSFNQLGSDSDNIGDDESPAAAGPVTVL